jgi:hypothetical protein
LGTYLHLDARQLEELWATNGLRTPLNWLRTQPRDTQLELLAAAGSLKILGKRLGCSEAALRPIYLGEPARELDWDRDYLLAQLERFGSIRAVAHMGDTTESLVRRAAEKHELDLADLVDYSRGNHSNAKGRRAELEFARLRGDRILADRNKIDGSQATHDFDDQDLGRVNVKSSRQWRYRAQSRSESPDYWKYGIRGRENCDQFVLMAYDLRMEVLVGVKVVRPDECTRTITLTREDFNLPESLTITPVLGTSSDIG